MQTSLMITGGGLDALANVLSEVPRKLPKQVEMVINNTAKGQVKTIAKKISTEIAITQTNVKKYIRQEKKAMANEDEISANVFVRGRKRFPLKYFKARQTKKGVSYKIKKGKGNTKRINSAFGPNIGKLGNHVYMRGSPGSDPKGQPRTPIRKLWGPSVLAVYLKNGMLEQSEIEIAMEMEKQVAKRLRSIVVSQIKKMGRVSGLSESQINKQLQALSR